MAEGLQIGYLPQVLAAGETLTLDELIAQSQARVRAVEAHDGHVLADAFDVQRLEFGRCRS